MSTAAKQDESDDEFESADEGESIPTPIVKSVTPPTHPSMKIKQNTLPPVTDGWGDWNIDDEPALKLQ